MPRWPGDPAPQLVRDLDLAAGDGVTLSRVSLSAHAGTHVDAPAHYLRGGATVDTLGLEVGLGPARVIAVRGPRKVGAAELAAHRPRRGERLLLRTGARPPRPGRGRAPRPLALGLDGAELLAARGVALLGIDALSVGPAGAEGDAVHRALLAAGIWIVEGLDLGAAPPGRYDLCCLPLRLVGAEGAPARVALRRR
jgi:arylformamidase